MTIWSTSLFRARPELAAAWPCIIVPEACIFPH
jgi:hypothetical protein